MSSVPQCRYVVHGLPYDPPAPSLPAPVHATARIAVLDWHTVPIDHRDARGARLLRVTVRKALQGDIEGESVEHMLLFVCDPADPDRRLMYVARERVTGRIGDRAGSFVIEHWGLSGAGSLEMCGGEIVAGSGTGDFAGMSGTFEIADDGGTSTLRLRAVLAPPMVRGRAPGRVRIAKP